MQFDYTVQLQKKKQKHISATYPGTQKQNKNKKCISVTCQMGHMWETFYAQGNKI